MALPLMPKATAVWLVEHTTLTFEQIAEFCGLHKLEVQAIADGEVAVGIVGLDPVFNGQLTAEEIKRCENDPRGRLKMTRSDLPAPVARTKGARYTPVSKRGEKPDAISYLLKNHPELLDAQIARLLGTTKETINKVRERTHWNAANIKPQNPVLMGLVKSADLEAAVKRAQRRIAREQKAKGIAPEAANESEDTASEGFIAAPDAGDNDQPDIDHDAMMRTIG
ncbi:MAG: DUF1013 domain-containing protein [Alphaproteobacteria bacterium]|nr:DUF1013 domain-containing protein [Alphaproteobacteria bacterium]